MGGIKDQKVVDRLDAALREDEDVAEAGKLISEIKEELVFPFYYHVPTITKKLGMSSISPYRVREKLSEIGYRTSGTHMERSAIKTDAGLSDVVSCIKDR